MSREMKDSGIEWIGEVPEGWNLSKISNLYNQRIEKVSDKDFQPLSVTMKGIVPQLDTAAKTNDGDNRKLVLNGDFAINSRSDRRGSCGISYLDGSVSLINIVLSPRNKMNSKYYNWLFHTSVFADEFYRWGHGIVDDLWTTRWSEMKNISIPVPTLSEQQRIATFLDKKCGEVDSMIALQEEMISELQAYKQSVITEAVTHGLNPNVKMKDSGIEWIGEIPENWDVTRIKNISVFCPSKKEIVHDVIAYAPMECLRNDILEHKEIESSKITSGLTYFEEGDIIMAKVTPCFENGNIAIAKGLKNGVGFGSSELFVFRNKESVANRYLFYSLQNVNLKQRCCATMTGTGGLKRVSPIYMVNTYIIVPSLPEQQNIASYLDAKCSDIDRLISLKQEKIESLKAYKQSIIYEYVTGKLSVKF